MRKNIIALTITTWLATFIIVKFIYKVTGFTENLSPDMIELSLMVNIFIWAFVYFCVYSILKIAFPAES